MSKYSAKTFNVAHSADDIAAKFEDLTALQPMLDKLSPEDRAKVGDLQLTSDSIAVTVGPVGQITFRVLERSPRRVAMRAEGSPVPLVLGVDMTPTSADATDVQCSVDVDIPMMLRPMVGPQLEKAVEMLSDVIKKAIG